MAYGIIEYDEQGKPICEECGKSFDRLMTHVRQKHDLSAREYKVKYGLDVGKGILSPESAQLSRQHMLNHYDKVVEGNLIKRGKQTRFKQGDKGRTRDQLSHQTRLQLVERFSSPKMVEARKKSGEKIGNKDVWGKKTESGETDFKAIWDSMGNVERFDFIEDKFKHYRELGYSVDHFVSLSRIAREDGTTITVNMMHYHELKTIFEMDKYLEKQSSK